MNAEETACTNSDSISLTQSKILSDEDIQTGWCYF